MQKLDKKAVAKEFCPILRFDKKAKYTPTNFLELFRKSAGEIAFNCSDAKAQWQKAKFDKATGLVWFEPTIYVHFLEDLNVCIRRKIVKIPLVIQYYYYFAYNKYLWGKFQVPFLEHDHDWELIQIALNKDHEIISYSMSAHGTFLGISNQTTVNLHQKEGFRCNRGAHNFGSIFQTPNQPRKKDIKIESDTLVPTMAGKYRPFKETIIVLEEEYEIDFLKKFSFLPIRGPWERDFFHAATWKPEFWSWSAFQRFVELTNIIKTL